MHRENVIHGLDARGHVNGFFGGSSEQEIDEPLRRVLCRPAWNSQSLVRDEDLERALWKFAGQFRPDVVHVHQTPYFPTELYDQLAALGVPIVQTAYDYGLLCTNSWGVLGDGTPCSGGPGAKCFENGCEKNYPFSPAAVWTAKRRLDLVRDLVDVVICPTEHMATMLGDHGIRNVVKLPYFPAAKDLEPVSLHERSRRTLLVVARLEREKGVDRAIHAFAEVLLRVPDAELEIVGEGPERDALQRLAERLGVEHTVRFTGRLSPEETTERIARSCALLLPSLWMEALPLITFDARATGTPLVGNRIGGITAAIDDGVDGYLVDAADPASFARGMERLLLDDVHWQSVSVATRKRFSQYTEAHHLDGIEQVYGRAGREYRLSAPLDLEELDARAVEDHLIRHVGSLEGELASLRGGLTGRLLKVERFAAMLVSRALELRGTLTRSAPHRGQPVGLDAAPPRASGKGSRRRA